MTKKQVYALFTIIFITLTIAASYYGGTQTSFENWLLGAFIFLGLYSGEYVDSKKNSLYEHGMTKAKTSDGMSGSSKVSEE